MQSQLRCPVCKKALEPSPCLRCDGTGSTRFLVLLKATCTTCGGSGSQVRCPDLPLHINQGPIAGPPQSGIVVCHNCLGAGFIGYGGMAAGGGKRCEVCDGAGVIPRGESPAQR